jgi:starch synthase
VGGLVKVEDGVTGFAFTEYSPETLLAAMLKAITVYKESPEQILRMQKTAATRIRQKYTWDMVVQRYLALYEKARRMLD